MRIAVIGGGVMGEALMRALVGQDPRPELIVAEKRPERAAQLVADLGVETAEPREAVRGADVVLLAVKPQDLLSLLDQMGREIQPGSLVLSIAAGIPTSQICARVPSGVDVVRAMPNTPARIGLGMTGVSAAPGCSEGGRLRAAELMACVGKVVEVPEPLQDAVTAVSGSGPAYLFLLAESMLQAAVDQGLEPGMADAMVRQTLVGAAQLLAQAVEGPDVLRENVTSPNGTTAAALAVMDRRGVRPAIVEAMAAAVGRSRELSGS